MAESPVPPTPPLDHESQEELFKSAVEGVEEEEEEESSGYNTNNTLGAVGRSDTMEDVNKGEPEKKSDDGNSVMDEVSLDHEEKNPFQVRLSVVCILSVLYLNDSFIL